jgi:hypothetical protein
MQLRWEKQNRNHKKGEMDTLLTIMKYPSTHPPTHTIHITSFSTYSPTFVLPPEERKLNLFHISSWRRVHKKIWES